MQWRSNNVRKLLAKIGREDPNCDPRMAVIELFSDIKSTCWFLEPEFAKQVVRLHKVVENAETEGRHIVVGTGSSQLYLAALYARLRTCSLNFHARSGRNPAGCS
ncbi:hypothetical protein TIFTF001_016992 [Ficus carica]|uniref:Alliinase C-terminal domain-containing protein n=1 Tax=Ficus carica TaxID=3494 RepID=A0AA88A445_FICCA|nr:hypothetical protein TIFTF001_016992 [Ficus carica]